MNDHALNEAAVKAGGMRIQADFEPEEYAMWRVRLVPRDATGAVVARRGTLSEAVDAALAEAGAS